MVTPEQLSFRAGVPGLPIDVEAIARHLGCTLHRPRSEPRWSSCLDRRDGTPRIWVRPTRLVWERFSVAHALAHLLLEGHDAPLYRETDYLTDASTSPAVLRASSSPCRQELEANRWAMRLLMPEAAVRLQLERRGVQALPEVFGVSEALCRARIRILLFAEEG